MKKKIYIYSLAVALTLAVVALINGTILRPAAASSGNALSSLPASDIVITVDTQRLLSETLPTMLADNPALLAKANTKIELFNTEMGIDLRTFDSVAVGLRFVPPSADNFDAVVVASGHFNSSQVIEAAFATAKKKHGDFQRREEQREGKTIFIVDETRRATLKSAPPAATTDTPQVEGEAKFESRPNRSSKQMAIVALDATTLAFGDLKSVRAAVDASLGRERVDDELVRMATQNPSALIGFSGRIPSAMTEKMAASSKGMEAKYMASIRKFYGSLSTVGADIETFVAVQTEKPNQAQDISQALNAMKLLSGFSIAQPSRGEIRSLAEVLKDLSITAQDNEVQIKLNIKQKDLAPFMRRHQLTH